MSRNLCQTECDWCTCNAVAKTGPDREITEQDAGRYFAEYEKMIVADAECMVCGAKYLAWVDERRRAPYEGYRFHQHAEPDHYDDPRQAFFDLSYRKAFNDEPADDDCGDPNMRGGLALGKELAQLREQLAAANERAERAEASEHRRSAEVREAHAALQHAAKCYQAKDDEGLAEILLKSGAREKARQMARAAQSRNADLAASHARLLEAANAEAQHMEAAADVTGDKVHEKWLLERARALRAAIDAAKELRAAKGESDGE